MFLLSVQALVDQLKWRMLLLLLLVAVVDLDVVMDVAEDVVDKDVVGLEILIYHASICNACRKILI